MLYGLSTFSLYQEKALTTARLWFLGKRCSIDESQHRFGKRVRRCLLRVDKQMQRFPVSSRAVMCLASICQHKSFFSFLRKCFSNTTFLPVNKVCTLSTGLDLSNHNILEEPSSNGCLYTLYLLLTLLFKTCLLYIF